MEEKKENQVPQCGKTNDLRTFAIALITAVIVVALYHLGTGLCKIFCSDSCDAAYPAPRYMLVRVMDVPMAPDEGMHHHPGPGKFVMRGRHHFHPGGPHGKRPGFKGKGRFRKEFAPGEVKPADQKPEEPKKEEAAPAPAAK